MRERERGGGGWMGGESYWMKEREASRRKLKRIKRGHSCRLEMQDDCSLSPWLDCNCMRVGTIFGEWQQRLTGDLKEDRLLFLWLLACD